MNNIIRFMGSRIARYSALYSVIRFFYRHSKLLYNKFYIFFYYGRSEQWNRYIYVNPEEIKYKSKKGSNKYRDAGKVIAGDWDMDVIHFQNDYYYYNSIKDIIEGKKKWEETELYKVGLAKIHNGIPAFGCKTEVELKKRAEVIFNLYEDIKKNGYRLPAVKNGILNGTSDEISVFIGRSGEILFDDGGHRLSIAQLLKVDKIPVQVVFRHRAWDELRKTLLLDAARNGGEIYQKVRHPDLDFIPASHNPSERLKMLEPHLDKTTGKLLDIGANWGIFCHRFEEIGFHCVAVENDPVHINILEKLRTTFGKKFEIYKGSIFDLDTQKKGPFEIVLALNIFYHFLKTPELYKKLIVLLENIHTKCIFFETHKYSELDSPQYYKNYTEEEFVEFVKKHSNLKNSKNIGRAEDGRALFKIW